MNPTTSPLNSLNSRYIFLHAQSIKSFFQTRYPSILVRPCFLYFVKIYTNFDRTKHVEWLETWSLHLFLYYCHVPRISAAAFCSILNTCKRQKVISTCSVCEETLRWVSAKSLSVWTALFSPIQQTQNLILLQVHLTQSCHKCIKRRTKFRSLYLKNKHLQHASCRLQSERCSYYLKPPKDDELHSFRTNYASSSK